MTNLFVVLITVLTMSHTHNNDKLITDLSIDHLVKYPFSYSSNDTQKRYPLILALHGHGSNERDLIGLSSHLPENLLWISGRGPHTYAKDAYDWYEVTQMGSPDPTKIAIALKTINTFIDELIDKYPIDTDKIFLLGFSQGSMISMSYLMASPKKIAGIIAQSGYIPPNIGTEIDNLGIKGKSIIITHGLEDPNMPISWGRKNRDTFLEFGADVTYKEFHMGHSISMESLIEINKWLEKRW